MYSTTALPISKITENQQTFLKNHSIVTNTSNLNKIKSAIKEALNTKKPVIYLQVDVLNENCLEVLRIAKLNNVTVVFMNNSCSKESQKFTLPKAIKNTLKLCLEDGIRYIKYKNITRLESVSNYTFIYTNLFVKPFISSKTLKFYEQRLNETQFIRTHRSHLVNKAYVKTYIGGAEKCLRLKNKEHVKVSRRKLKNVLAKIGYAF